jgi:hypothetical protein
MIPNHLSISSLKESLHYLHVHELRGLCTKLSLSTKGKKVNLIFRIIKFVETGEKLILPSYPSISCVKRNTAQELSLNSLILKGAYKNDLKTRMFFKELIGSHFHFTAFGIDWLENRWMAGDPPTFQEFAQMWQSEYIARKKAPAVPKAEWAYINFVQKYIEDNPDTTKEAILRNWNTKRHQHKNYVDKFMLSVCHKYSKLA